MNNILEKIVDWFPEIVQAKYWGALITGGLFTYLANWLGNRFDSRYYEWKIVKRLFIIDAVLLVVLLFLSLQWEWYLLLILPWGYFIARYFYFKQTHKRLIASLKSKNHDLNRYYYLLNLEKTKLCSWEVRRYLFSALNVLFEIGAMKHLDKQLNLLKDDYGNLFEWKQLKSFLCYNLQEYNQMLKLLQDYEEDKHLTKEERNRTVINIYNAYRLLDNEEGVRTYIPKLEKIVFDNKDYTIEALDNLLYHYETTNNEEGVKKVINISNKIKTKNFSTYIAYIDLQYMHNKRIGNIEGNRRLLDEMARKQTEMGDDEEQGLRFKLRLLKLYFENNYAWMEYSIYLFQQADKFLAYSQDIAFEYMEAVMLVLQNAKGMYNISIPSGQIMYLFQNIRNYIDKYIPKYDKTITNLPDDFVYRKKEMLMHKVTYSRLIFNLTKNEPSYLKEMCRLENQIIRLCQNNGEERERLHFLVVLTDDILTYYDVIQLDIENGVTDDDILLAEKEKPIFMEQVKQNMEIIDNVLRENDYNRSLAYYIFYQSYFNFKVGNIENARYALHKFEDTNVSIQNFTIAIQKLYQQVKDGVNK